MVLRLFSLVITFALNWICLIGIDIACVFLGVHWIYDVRCLVGLLV